MANTDLARDMMSHPVRELTEDMPVRDAAAFLLRHGISGAPVLDARGQWVGVFTQNDLARAVEQRLAPPGPERTLESREPVTDLLALPPEELARTPVKAFMTYGLFTVFPEATKEEVVRTLTRFKIHRVFVIDENTGKLLGIITTMDVLRRRARKKKPAGKTGRPSRCDLLGLHVPAVTHRRGRLLGKVTPTPRSSGIHPGSSNRTPPPSRSKYTCPSR